MSATPLTQNTPPSYTPLRDSIVDPWLALLSQHDRETEAHCYRVAALTLQFAQHMGIDQTQHIHISRGALLHDLGKIKIPDAILFKPGPLTQQEWIEMRRHPDYGVELLARTPALDPALDILRYHHERWDGTGYPHGLSATQIPLAARLFAVVDAWDALRSDRPYRPAWSHQKAQTYIAQQAGTHFDPAVVSAFLTLQRDLPIGFD